MAPLHEAAPRSGDATAKQPALAGTDQWFAIGDQLPSDGDELADPPQWAVAADRRLRLRRWGLIGLSAAALVSVAIVFSWLRLRHVAPPPSVPVLAPAAIQPPPAPPPELAPPAPPAVAAVPSAPSPPTAPAHRERRRSHASHVKHAGARR